MALIAPSSHLNHRLFRELRAAHGLNLFSREFQSRWSPRWPVWRQPRQRRLRWPVLTGRDRSPSLPRQAAQHPPRGSTSPTPAGLTVAPRHPQVEPRCRLFSDRYSRFRGGHRWLARSAATTKPRRPRAKTCCFFSSFKTLPTRTRLTPRTLSQCPGECLRWPVFR
jgi:hypothetical protein